MVELNLDSVVITTMSQATEQETTWVLMSQIRDDIKKEDLERITPEIIELVDQWQSRGKFIWSGPLSDDKTGMAIFEGTKEEADRFYDKYDKICSGILEYHLYQWESMPLLGVL